MASPVFGPQACASSSAANLTGPCLVVGCSQNTDYGASCVAEISLCTSGSVNYRPYFDTNSYQCQYYCTQDCISDCPNDGATLIQSDDCGIYELAGQIGGAGTVWSLYDEKSTVTLDYSTYTDSGGAHTVFYVDELDAQATAQYNYFITKAMSEDAARGTPAGTNASPSTSANTIAESSITTVSSESAGLSALSSALRTTTTTPSASAASTTTPSPAIITTASSISASTAAVASMSNTSISGCNRKVAMGFGARAFLAISAMTVIFGVCVLNSGI